VPVREGAAIVDAHGHKLGTVTSGTLAPSVNQPIAMAYLPSTTRSRSTRCMPRCAASACRCA
jgi:glycine cleavage system aminomethyltransferase T